MANVADYTSGKILEDAETMLKAIFGTQAYNRIESCRGIHGDMLFITASLCLLDYGKNGVEVHEEHQKLNLLRG
ncbi:hypothetical protein C5S39_06455 [Candidatus Methanophagaceae archaeon]|nr:hypothetical protein C5S39_06455 [Methanophagales archaeon]